MIIFIVFIVLLVFFIAAQIMSKNGKMVFIAGAGDMVLVLLCVAALLVASFCDVGQFSTAQDSHRQLNTAQIICYVVAGLCFLGSFFVSIASNRGDITGMIVSILAKVFVVWFALWYVSFCIAILILLLIFKVFDWSYYSSR